MKKTYIQPLTEVVKVNAEQLICQSAKITNGSQDNNYALGKDDCYYDENLW